MLGPIIIVHHELMGIKTMIIQSYKPEVKVKRRKKQTQWTDSIHCKGVGEPRRSKEIT